MSQRCMQEQHKGSIEQWRPGNDCKYYTSSAAGAGLRAAMKQFAFKDRSQPKGNAEWDEGQPEFTLADNIHSVTVIGDL